MSFTIAKCKFSHSFVHSFNHNVISKKIWIRKSFLLGDLVYIIEGLWKTREKTNKITWKVESSLVLLLGPISPPITRAQFTRAREMEKKISHGHNKKVSVAAAAHSFNQKNLLIQNFLPIFPIDWFFFLFLVKITNFLKTYKILNQSSSSSSFHDNKEKKRFDFLTYFW